MAGTFERSWDLIAEHVRPLAMAVCLAYMPYYLLYAAVKSQAWLPDEATDVVFGLLGGVFVLPFTNAVVVALADGWRSGRTLTLGGAVRVAGRSWSRLLVSYISVSLVLFAWLALTVLPCYVAMMVADLQRPLYLVPVAAVTAAFVLPRFAFLDALVVVAGMSPWEARQRSAELASGRRLKLLGVGLLTMGPPFALDVGGDALSATLKASGGQLALALELAAGLASALLSVLPLVLFYLYYRDVTAAPAPTAAAAAAVSGGAAADVGGPPPSLAAAASAKVLDFRKPLQPR